ncbi:MAG: Mrp/NBP35 family ATP-binding protein [Planctomycetota bacterium]
MDPTLQQIREVLSDLLAAERVVEAKTSEGKVTLTVAVDLPTADKPRFAEEIKARVRTLAGVKGVLVSFARPAPAPAEARDNPLADVKRIVAVGAGKGGVGKSTVAVNLAVALASAGHRAGLLDADVYGPSAGMMTGTQDHKAKGDAQQRVIPAERHGIKIISVAFLLPEDKSAVVWRGPMVGKMVTQLLVGVAWGELDFLVVDLPPGTGDAALSLAQTVPLSGAVVVTTPQDVALLDVLKAMEMFHSVKVPIVGIVENMAGFTCGHCGKVTPIFLEGAGRKAAARFGVPLLGSLPLDPDIPPGGDSGRPIAIEAPDGPSGRVFAELARKLPQRLDELGAGPSAGFDLAWK